MSMKNCKQCGISLETTSDDLGFYEKISPTLAGRKHAIPAPSFCQDCRRQRRFSFRNERHLYHRTCDLTGKQIVSNFAPDAGCKVYARDDWFGDGWDPRAYGQDIDFSRPFFEQYAELRRNVPYLSLSLWNSENSDYCNYVGHVKNCYLIFGSVYSEDCYYGSLYYSKDCIDTLVVRECERSYECIDCRKLNNCLYCQDCHSSSDLLYCFDLQGCNDCIGCAGLRKKQYYISNKSVGKDEYERIRASLDLCDAQVRDRLEQELRALILTIPHRYMQSAQVENVSGNYVYQSKNTHDSYYADRCEDCRYCAQVVDLRDCYDNNYTEENELCYEYLGAYQNHHLLFSLFCNRVSEGMYCDACHSSKNLFGCCGMRNAEYCILNKQCTKEVYEDLVSKLIQHMQRTSEWGEFFPASMSPFGYNETVAQEYFPLTQKNAKSSGFRWRDGKQKVPNAQRIIPAAQLPSNISEIPDDILNWAIVCDSTKNPFKLVTQELQFYRDMKLPVPRLHPDERHRLRMERRNPRKLWRRQCMKCRKEILTIYASDRPEIVYCEECYLKEVY